jgi:ribosomal protein S18 acetylase RimI-like enzyme
LVSDTTRSGERIFDGVESFGFEPAEVLHSPLTTQRVQSDVQIVKRQDPEAVERLLRSLPDWFGVEESLIEYVSDATRKPTYLALSTSGDVVGALLVTRHFPGSAEMHLLAVDPGVHRSGIGRALVDEFERDMASDGVRLLEVKTQGPSRQDEHYATTLAFYLAMGYEPLDEILDYWPENPCLILVKVLNACP